MEHGTARGTLAPDKTEIQRRYQALGWSQNEMARRVRKSRAQFSRWLHNQTVSSVIERKSAQVLARAEARRNTNGKVPVA